MPHLSELHGASTHLAVVAAVLYGALLVVRRTGHDQPAVAAAERWTLGGALVGLALTGLTGLLVRGQAQTELRGHENNVGAIHFWLGFVLAALLLGGVLITRRPRAQPWSAAALATLLIAGVTVQGYLGGRMTYEHGVGVQDAGAFAQSARGAADLELALAKGTPPAQAGKTAFTADELGCAACHGDHAQGGRGPALGGGRRLDEFRRVHGNGLFPRKIVSDRDFAAIVAYLRRVPGRGEG